MKTPDTEWLDRAKEDIDTNLKHMSNQPILNTPDTEWSKELFRLASLVGTDAKNPKEKLLAYVQEALTSHDTHWKERVRWVIVDWANQKENPIDVTDLLDTLLDNLK